MSLNKLSNITALICNQKEFHLIEFGMSYVPSGSEIFKDYHHDFFLTFTVQSNIPRESYSSHLPPSSQWGFRERVDFVRLLIKLEAGSHINLKASCSFEQPKSISMEERFGNRSGAGVSPAPHGIALQQGLYFTVFKTPMNRIFGHQ